MRRPAPRLAHAAANAASTANPEMVTKRKTGLERCVHREDKRVLSEINWKDGKRNGAAFYHDYNDRRIVATFKDDRAEGPAQVFSKENKLLCDMKFATGSVVGAVRELYPSGKLKAGREIVGEREGDGHIELLENGKLTTLRCAKQSMVPEDIAPCGFDGKVSRVQLPAKTASRFAMLAIGKAAS